METQQNSTDVATIVPQGMNGNHNDVSISYEEYKALETGFLEEKRKLEDRMWLDSNMSRFDEILRQNYDSSARKFSDKVVHYMAKVTGAVHGAFFTVDYETHTVNATGGYACTVETMDRTTFNFGEGLVGQVAKSKEIMTLDNVETQLDSSLGRISACFLTILPLVFNDRVYGIVELTTLNKLKPRYIILLERMSRSVAAVLQSLLNNQKTKELLIESLNHSEEFKKQHEEVRRRDEMIQALRDQLQLKEQEIQQLLGSFKQNEAGISAETFANLNSELLTAQNALEQMRQEWQAQQGEITQLTSLQNEYNAQIEKLKEQEQKIKDLTESLHWKHEEIERQGNSLQERKQEIERLQHDLTEKENENKRFLEEIIRQEKSLQQKEQTLANLHTQLKDTVANAHVPAEMSQLKEALQQKENLLQELKHALELEHLNYVEQAESVTKVGEEADQKATALQNLEQQWSVQTQIWQSWQETAHEREAELKTLQAEKIEKDTLIAQLQADFAQKEAFAQELEKQVSQLQEDYQAQQTVLNSLKEEREQKDQELQTIKDELARSKGSDEQFKAQISQYQREMQELQTRLTKKEDELLVSQYMFNQMQANPLLSKETERLTNELEKKEQEIKQLQTMIAREDIKPRTSEDNSLASNEKTSEYQETIEHLQMEINRYTEAYEALNKSYEETAEDLNNVKQYAELKEGEVEHLQKLLQEAQEAEPQDVPEISNLVAELRQKESEVEELEEKLKAYQSPDSYIQKQYENIQQKIKDLEIVQQHLADREAEITYLRESLEAEKDRVAQNHTARVEENSVALHQAQEELKQLRNQIEFRQEEVRRREGELASLFNKINNAFAMLEISMEGRILSANNKMLFLLGLASEEMILEEYTKFLKPEFVFSNQYKQIWSELSKVGATQIVEELIMTGRKEREVKMSVTFVPILDKDGKPYQIIQVVNFLTNEEVGYTKMVYNDDISELAETGTTLEATNVETSVPENVATETPAIAQVAETLEFDEEREIFKAIQNSFMLLELDTHGNITDANHQIALCLGYSEQELVGKLHASLLHEDEQDSEGYQDILSHMSEGHYATEVLTYIGKEGEKIRLRSYFNPLKDKDEKTRKVLVMSQYVH
jgi:PAS domain S-box-containing protein